MLTKITAFAKKMIIKRGRKAPPSKLPHWCFFISGVIFSFCVLIFPLVRLWIEGFPLTGPLVKNWVYWPYVRIVIPFLLGALPFITAVNFFCRGIQVCFPDELEAFQSEKELGY